MKLMKKLRSSLMYRLAGTFLLLLFSIYLMGLYIYSGGVSTVKNEIYKSTKQQAGFYLEQLAEEMERIKILQLDCLTDESLLKLAHRYSILEDYERISSMLMVYQRLLTIKSSSTYINDVSVHIASIGKTISTNSMVSDLNATHYEQIRIDPPHTGAQFIDYEGTLYLSTARVSDTPTCFVEVKLDRGKFVDALEQFTLHDAGNSFMYSHENSFFVSYDPNYDAVPAVRLLEEQHHEGVGTSTVNGRRYLHAYVSSEYLGMTLVRLLPEKLIFTPLNNFYIWIWAFTFASIAVIAFFSVQTYKWIHQPLITLTDAFRSVEDGDFDVALHLGYQNEFDYLFNRFNVMVSNLSTLIDQAYRMKILAQRAELKQLQSQINPHFLYNSLFIVNTMARVGDENLLSFTKHLGEYFRFVTKNAPDYVTLVEEVAHARNYAEIQQVRFASRLTLEFEECPEEYVQMRVPRLIIQPILENSFEHAVEKSMAHCTIEVKFRKTEEMLEIEIGNSGRITEEDILEIRKKLERENGVEAEISGLVNVHRRLQMIYGDRSGLRIARGVYGGLLVRLSIWKSRG